MEYRGFNWFKSMGVVLLLVFAFAIGSMAGCTQNQKKSFKHFESGLIGLQRKVTLYDANGQVIRTWTGRFKIEINGAYISFIDNGKDVKVSGTVVVQEQ